MTDTTMAAGKESSVFSSSGRPIPIRLLQLLRESAEKVVPVFVPYRMEPSLHGTADMTCTVVDEEHILPWPVHKLQDIVKVAAVMFAFPHVEAVEYEIEPGVEAEPGVDLVEPVGLITQDPHGESMIFKSLHQLQHPGAQREAIQDLHPQGLIGSPDMCLTAKGVPPAGLPRPARKIPRFDDQIVALPDNAIFG